LLEWIDSGPVEVLGARVAERFGGSLPFLFKVLAAEQPLSIQAHPDARQARVGFARENAQGIDLEAPERNYRDASHKPELVCALTRFEALRGFLPVSQVRDRLDRVGASSLAPPAGTAEPEALRVFLRELLALPAAPRENAVARAAEAAQGLAEEDPAFAWVERLQRAYPGDPGVLSPLFLQSVLLEPGQAMFLPAGELHCYLQGVALEVMANSDNVLRGGLTQKHVDPEELQRVLYFRDTQVEVLDPQAENGVERYRTPAEEFELARVRVGAGDCIESAPDRCVEIALCTEGQVRLRPDGGEELALQRGESCVIPAAVGRYRLEGDGTIYRASVPG
jgi:mannose-6-phosphate isomerase